MAWLRAARRRTPRDIHRVADFANGRDEPDEDRARDDRVTDVELLDLRNRGDGREVARGEAVSRMHREAELGGDASGVAQRVRARGVVRVMREVAGVQLDRVGADA